MLYDNAQLVRAYLHAWQITGEPAFKRIVTETLDFTAREMTHPEGGFLLIPGRRLRGRRRKILCLDERRDQRTADR
jgi:hypothetical protein